MKSYTEQIADLKARIAADTAALARIEKIVADDGVPPQHQKLIGSRWPFTKGSVARACFKYALAGVTVKKLKHEVEAIDYRFEPALKALRSGKTSTHSWTLVEKNGKLSLRNVKVFGQ